MAKKLLCSSMLLLLLGLLLVSVAQAQEQIVGPSDPTQWQQWQADNVALRDKTLASISYNASSSAFSWPELQWCQNNWVSPQMHLYDLFFYDRAAKKYTVDRWLDDLNTRYGGIDSALVWSSYPNIGVDDRNQYDLARLSPAGLVDAIDQLRAKGVRVLLPLNPWDSGTQPSGYDSDATALAHLMADLHADGFNGDTMALVQEAYQIASIKIAGHPAAIEPELGGTLDMLKWSTLGWGYWTYPSTPSVDRWKWLEQRRLTHVCNRWAKDHTNDLQAAWFNGDGFVSWENVWGCWNGITPRDGETVRRIYTIARFIGSPNGFFQSPDWLPYFPVVDWSRVFASSWPKGEERLWTLVSRWSQDIHGPVLRLDNTGKHYYDLYNGIEIAPQKFGATQIQLSIHLEANGYGAILETPNNSSAELQAFLDMMHEMTSGKPLSSFSNTWQYLQQKQVVIEPTTPAASAPTDNMVKIPAGQFHFVSSGVSIEGDDAHGVDFQMPWESHPQRNHDQTLQMSAFWMDKYPVTNAEYLDFVQKTNYVPDDDRNFLKFIGGGKTPVPSGWEDKPVTWISMDEARMYCKWAGKRLPHETEWAYAAQGTDGRKYPWGNDKNQSNFPVAQHGRSLPGPDSVYAHSPAGDSPFGVADMVGNVWQWTDEYVDDHTSAAVVRGSSNYRPLGSNWYFPVALELNLHNKYLLFDDAYDRAGTIGFRCVADAL